MIKGTVLVVDRDDMAQFVVTGILREAGFGVVRAYDAVSALCVHAALPLIAIVTSSHSPDVDGIEFLKMLHDLNPAVPLIFVTGQEGMPRVLEAAAGARRSTS